MYKNKFTVKKILTLAIFSFLFCALFSSCSFLENFKVKAKIPAPIIAVDLKENVLQWNSVPNATTYEVYLNDALVENVENTEQSVVSFDYSSHAQNEGVYGFSIKATSTNADFRNSDISNLVFVNVSEDMNFLNTEYADKLITDASQSPSYSIDNQQLLISGTADKYIVEVFSNSKKLMVFETTDATFDFSHIASENPDDILVMRVGAYVLSDDLVYVSDDYLYYNAASFGVYTNTIYYFDGEVHDLYINTPQELTNVLYYNFVARVGEYSIKLTDKMISHIQSAKIYETAGMGEIVLKSFGSSAEKQIYFVDASFDNFVETSYYIKYPTTKNEVDNTFAIKIDFQGVKQSDLLIDLRYAKSRSVSQNELIETYYDTYDYSNERPSDYDDFVSDKYFLKQEVDTSDELYWAVENFIVPIPKAGSRAQMIYEDAKSVLRAFITDDMSDFEKALVIFDLVASTTIYDYIDNSKLLSEHENPTKNNSYYLEGVFFYYPWMDVGTAVCDGFSKSFSLFCNMEGIETVRIVGSAVTGSGSGLHAWNKIKIDDNWYLVDITWTELLSATLTAYGYEYIENLAHKYFLVTDKFVKDSHFNWEGRDKFDLYPTPLNPFNYYEQIVLSYEEGSVSISEDLVIESDEELENYLFYHMYTNKYSSEIVITYDYVSTMQAGTELTDVEVIFNKLRELKFDTQYLHIVRDSEYILFDGQNYGKIFVIGFTMLLDSDGELEALYEFYDGMLEWDVAAADFEIILYVKKSYLITKVDFSNDAEEMLLDYLQLVGLDQFVDLVYVIEGYSSDGSGDYYYIFLFQLKAEP